jgi:hypothetical protein
VANLMALELDFDKTWAEGQVESFTRMAIKQPSRLALNSNVILIA